MILADIRQCRPTHDISLVFSRLFVFLGKVGGGMVDDGCAGFCAVNVDQYAPDFAPIGATSRALFASCCVSRPV
jgi:hypothetical protein